MIISDETLDNVILSVSEGSHENLSGRPLRMTIVEERFFCSYGQNEPFLNFMDF